MTLRHEQPLTQGVFQKRRKSTPRFYVRNDRSAAFYESCLRITGTEERYVAPAFAMALQQEDEDGEWNAQGVTLLRPP